MVQGSFIKNTPFVKIRVGWKELVETYPFVLDTGFSGDMLMTYEMVKDLNLNPDRVIPIKTASGDLIDMPVAVAIIRL